MIRNLSVALVLFLSLGCLDDVEQQASTIYGTYTLRTVNGSTLPYTSPGGGANKVEILDDKFVLYQGNTFAQEGHVKTTTNGQPVTATNTQTGFFSIGGTSLIFVHNSGKPNRVAIAEGGLTLTIVEDQFTYIYKK